MSRAERRREIGHDEAGADKAEDGEMAATQRDEAKQPAWPETERSFLTRTGKEMTIRGFFITSSRPPASREISSAALFIIYKKTMN